LGNGPSLYPDLRSYVDTARQIDIFCVNQFAESDLYEKLRPKYYVFADPSYWLDSEPEEILLMVARVISRIKGCTSWPLTVYAPFPARRAFEAAFSTAPNIRVVYYNNVPVAGPKRFAYALYRFGVGAPHIQNVLVASLFLALRMGYKNVVLLGADHSWHQTLVLDAANQICVKDEHFYDSDAELKPFGEGRFNMHMLFTAFGKMFEGYCRIEDYSQYLGARIYNASSLTFIDAFQRRSLADALAEFQKDQ
jgi:hypothetical protein